MNVIFRKMPVSTMVLLTAAACRADLTVVQTVEDFQDNTPRGKEQITLQVSGKKVRMDRGQSLSSIILMDKKVTYSIMHGDQKYVALPHEQFKMDAKLAEKDASTAAGALDSMKIEATGKTEKISGYLCRQVLVREKGKTGGHTELWIAQDAMNMKTFLGEFGSFTEGLGMTQAFRELEKHKDLNGVPIRFIEYVGDKAVRRATIERLETNAVSPSVFEVPAGYSELKPSEVTAPPPELLQDDLKKPKL